jgi:isoleucyl-tRNA synthetase
VSTTIQVCSADYTGDVVLSHELMKAIADDYRKIRSSMRFLLQNTADFNPTKV